MQCHTICVYAVPFDITLCHLTQRYTVYMYTVPFKTTLNYTHLTRKFAMDIFCKSFNSLHLSVRFGDKFSGFGHQSEKFSHIGACIRRNFMPWTKYANHYDYHFHISFMVENDSYLSDFTVKTAFFSCWNRVFSHANNLTSLWYLSCKGAVKKRVDRVAAPYLEVLETSLYGVSTVFRW